MVEYRNSDETDFKAAQAAGIVTSWNAESGKSAMSEADVVAQLEMLALSKDAPLHGDVLALAQRAGVSTEMLADHYIPIVARALGADWCEDQLSFANVTIGVARLQAMLRELGPEWTADKHAHPNASAVLLAVPIDTHHTLGSMVLAGQLRRKGLSVRLVLGATPAMIGDLCAHTPFDAVFLSAVVGESLETLRKIVESAHASSKDAVPVVIGGTLLETQDNIVALTGADYVSNTADEAIELCKLSVSPPLKPTLGN